MPPLKLNVVVPEVRVIPLAPMVNVPEFKFSTVPAPVAAPRAIPDAATAPLALMFRMPVPAKAYEPPPELLPAYPPPGHE